MKPIRLSIKEHRLTNKYNPKFKQYDYTRDFDFENEDDIELIYENINLYVHTYYDYNDNNRNQRSFKSASAIFLDFDNKDGHNDSTIAEFLDSDLAQKYNWLFYTSKSHIADKQECFHVILPLDVQITDLVTLRSTYTAVFDEIQANGLLCDFKVRDGARLIFPSLNESYDDDDAHFDNFRFEYNHNGVYLELTEPVVVEESEVFAPKLFDIETDEEELSDHVREFYKMSKNSKYTYVKSIMKYMNRHNRKYGYTFLNYNRWIAIGFTLNKMFGETHGKKLFRILSSGHPKDSATTVDSQFKYLTECNYTSAENISILMRISASVGYSHTMYFKYYFMSKHRFRSVDRVSLYNRMLRILLDDYGFEDTRVKDAKIYDYSFKQNTRTFLMEVEGEIHQTVRLGEMMDIMAVLLDTPRQFITSAITKGVIRRCININGVYDITRYIKQKILTLLQETEGEFIRVSDVMTILKTIRSYAPSTIQSLLTNKNIEMYMFEVGIFTDKRKKRFNKPYMGYKVDRSKITISYQRSVPKTMSYKPLVIPKLYTIPLGLIHKQYKNLVMKC